MTFHWFRQRRARRSAAWVHAMNKVLDVERAYRDGDITEGEFTRQMYQLIQENQGVWR